MQERKFALMTLSASKDASEKAEWHQHPRRSTSSSDLPTKGKPILILILYKYDIYSALLNIICGIKFFKVYLRVFTCA